MGLKFELNGLYVYLYILKVRKFTVAVKFGTLATVIQRFFFFQLVIGFFLSLFFFSFKYLYELSYTLFRNFFAIT